MPAGASPESVKLGKAVGGAASPLHSIHWTRPLRPLRYGLSLVSPHAPLAAAAAAPFCAVLDAAATRLRRSPLRPTTAAPGEELTVDAIVDYSPQFLQGAALLPEYDRRPLDGLPPRAGHKAHSG